MSAPTAARPLIDQIAEIVATGQVCMPPLPEVEAQLSRLLEDEDVTTKAIVQVVQRDPSLTATILRLANSAAYGGLQPVSELQQALTRIGLNQLKRTVSAALHKGHFQNSRPENKKYLEQIWVHSIVTAVIARLLAEHAGGDQQQSFLSALLHDSGKLLVLRAVDHLRDSEANFEITENVLDELMVALHASLGHKTLEDWKLPTEVCEAARDHHNEITSQSSPLLVRIQAANVIAKGIARCGGDMPASEVIDEPAVAALNMTDVELAALIIDVEDEVEEMQSALG